jgi:hypothetical protein
MYVRFAVPELDQIDSLRCEALALPLFSDERPLRGALGLLDWRLCGFLSGLVERGKVSGERLETVLVPGRPKLGMDKLFMLGLGPSSGFDGASVRACLEHMLDTLARARVRSTALVLPGRNGNRPIAPASAMEAFVTCALHRTDHDELILLEPQEAQREMEPVMERERRRARAELG